MLGTVAATTQAWPPAASPHPRNRRRFGIGIGIGFSSMKQAPAGFIEKKFPHAVGCDHDKGDESDCDSDTDTDSEVRATLRR